MTNEQVRQVIVNAANRALAVNEFEAATFLRACELLQTDADHLHARNVVESFTNYFESGGVRKRTFSEGMLGRYEVSDDPAAQSQSEEKQK